MIYYYDDCTTCKNISLALCRETALRAGVLKKKYPQYQFPVALDERYVGALASWREEAETIITRAAQGGELVSLPFLYNEQTKEVLPLPKKLDRKDGEMMSLWQADVANFWGELTLAECAEDPHCSTFKQHKQHDTHSEHDEESISA